MHGVYVYIYILHTHTYIYIYSRILYYSARIILVIIKGICLLVDFERILNDIFKFI